MIGRKPVSRTQWDEKMSGAKKGYNKSSLGQAFKSPDKRIRDMLEREKEGRFHNSVLRLYEPSESQLKVIQKEVRQDALGQFFRAGMGGFGLNKYIYGNSPHHINHANVEKALANPELETYLCDAIRVGAVTKKELDSVVKKIQDKADIENETVNLLTKTINRVQARAYREDSKKKRIESGF
jgi:hypothetical protein